MLWGRLVTKVILCEFKADQLEVANELFSREVHPHSLSSEGLQVQSSPCFTHWHVILGCGCRELQSKESTGDAGWALLGTPRENPPFIAAPSLGGQAGLLLWAHIFTASSRAVSISVGFLLTCGNARISKEGQTQKFLIPWVMGI